MRGTRGSGHTYKDSCMCHRCKNERRHKFSIDATKVASYLLSRGGRTITGSLTDDSGRRGNTIPAAFAPTYDPTAHDIFIGLDPEGNERPEPLPFVDRSITATQNLRVKPLFTQGNPLIDLMPVVVQTMKDGKDVNIVHKVKARSGIKPIKTLLGPRPTFAEMDGVKRQTSRSKEIIRDKYEQIDPEVSRLSYHRPNYLVKQAEQEALLLDIELGLDSPDDPDLS